MRKYKMRKISGLMAKLRTHQGSFITKIRSDIKQIRKGIKKA